MRERWRSDSSESCVFLLQSRVTNVGRSEPGTFRDRSRQDDRPRVMCKYWFYLDTATSPFTLKKSNINRGSHGWGKKQLLWSEVQKTDLAPKPTDFSWTKWSGHHALGNPTRRIHSRRTSPTPSTVRQSVGLEGAYP
ncbi:hypothetical protein TNCV_1484371 [Trichonephila clavipes]|nr:hypothetical protein TNCV_1484371 [Trichonephila clavipes]